MQVNTINATGFGKLHIQPNKTNRAALERLMAQDKETLENLLETIDRESGEDNVYLHTGRFDSGNIDIAITNKEGSLLAMRRIGLGSPDNFKKGMERLQNRFIRSTLETEPEKPAKNKEVSAILNRYA